MPTTLTLMEIPSCSLPEFHTVVFDVDRLSFRCGTTSCNVPSFFDCLGSFGVEVKLDRTETSVLR